MAIVDNDRDLTISVDSILENDKKVKKHSKTAATVGSDTLKTLDQKVGPFAGPNALVNTLSGRSSPVSVTKGGGGADISNDPFAGLTVNPNQKLVNDGSGLVLNSFDKELQSISAAPQGGGTSPFSSATNQEFQAMLEANELPQEFRFIPGLVTADDATKQSIMQQFGKPSIGGPRPDLSALEALINTGSNVATPELAPTAFTQVQTPEGLVDLGTLLGGKDLTSTKFDQGADMTNLISALQAQASGKAPSVAEAVARQQHDKNLRAQMALAASAGGRALPVSQRQLLQQQAFGGQELLQTLAANRAAEQQAALSQLGSTLANVGQQKSAFQATKADLALGGNKQAQDLAIANTGFSNAATMQDTALEAAAIQAEQDRKAQAIRLKAEIDAQLAQAAIDRQREKEKEDQDRRDKETQGFVDAGVKVASSIITS